MAPFPSPRLRPIISLMLTRNGQSGGEARLHYLDGDIEVVEPGDYVTCAVTGRKIPIAALRYWSVDHQEAYVDAAAAASRMVEGKGAA